MLQVTLNLSPVLLNFSNWYSLRIFGVNRPYWNVINKVQIMLDYYGQNNYAAKH